MINRSPSPHRAAIVLAAIFAIAPKMAWAAPSYVDDSAHLLNAQTVAHINAVDDTLARRGGMTVTVVTVTGSGGPAHSDTVRAVAAAHHMTGALIYIAAADKDSALLVASKVAPLFTDSVQRGIVRDLGSALKAGQTDAGVTKAFDEIADTIAGGASGGHGPAPARAAEAQEHFTGADVSWIWWIIGFLVVLLAVRAVFTRRARAGENR